jgi:phosphoserine aminotransferase
VTGVWSQKAVKEAKRCGAVHVAASTEAEGFRRVPRADEIRLTPGAAYVHVTSNNTIYGTQFPDIPPLGDAPLVCDMSSDILSRPLDVERFGLIYAGAQKNLGPSGVTLVVVRDDLVERSPAGLHSMLSYRTHAEAGSLYNTPPTFGIYLMGLVLEWIEAQGGLSALARANERKAATLYAEIDRTGFYQGHAQPGSRSQMNVTFRLGSEGLDKAFCREATAQGLDGLKGHRSTGGVRASLYNALPEASVDALVAFMREFERTHG